MIKVGLQSGFMALVLVKIRIGSQASTVWVVVLE